MILDTNSVVSKFGGDGGEGYKSRKSSFLNQAVENQRLFNVSPSYFPISIPFQP